MTRSVRKAGAVVAVMAVSALAVVVITSRPADARQPLARVALRSAAGVVVGEVVFKGRGGHADRVEVELDLPTDAPGLGAYHGLHVHTTGACVAPSFASAGPHWNPHGAVHGHHAGDLPSVLVSPTGKAYSEFETHRFEVADLFDDDGSAVVLHNAADNFANIPAAYGGPNSSTLSTGDAGGRYACGTVTSW